MDGTASAPAGPPARKRGLARGLLQAAQSRWAKVRGALQSVQRAARLAALDKNQFKAEAQAAIQDAQAGSSGVKLTVTSQDLSKINYLQQGDASLYTPEALAQRHGIRRDSRVTDAAKAWWRWLPKPQVVLGTAGKGGVTRPVYCAMVVALQSVLLPMFGMEPDPDYDPSDDWEEDCKGEQVMLYPDFFDALFELADMWCESVSAEDYSSLLATLLSKCQELEASGQLFTKLFARFGYSPPQGWPAVNNEDTSQDSPTLTSNSPEPADDSTAASIPKQPPCTVSSPECAAQTVPDEEALSSVPDTSATATDGPAENETEALVVMTEEVPQTDECSTTEGDSAGAQEGPAQPVLTEEPLAAQQQTAVSVSVADKAIAQPAPRVSLSRKLQPHLGEAPPQRATSLRARLQGEGSMNNTPRTSAADTTPPPPPPPKPEPSQAKDTATHLASLPQPSKPSLALPAYPTGTTSVVPARAQGLGSAALDLPDLAGVPQTRWVDTFLHNLVYKHRGPQGAAHTSHPTHTHTGPSGQQRSDSQKTDLSPYKQAAGRALAEQHKRHARGHVYKGAAMHTQQHHPSIMDRSSPSPEHVLEGQGIGGPSAHINSLVQTPARNAAGKQAPSPPPHAGPAGRKSQLGADSSVWPSAPLGTLGAHTLTATAQQGGIDCTVKQAEPRNAAQQPHAVPSSTVSHDVSNLNRSPDRRHAAGEDLGIKAKALPVAAPLHGASSMQAVAHRRRDAELRAAYHSSLIQPYAANNSGAGKGVYTLWQQPSAAAAASDIRAQATRRRAAQGGLRGPVARQALLLGAPGAEGLIRTPQQQWQAHCTNTGQQGQQGLAHWAAKLAPHLNSPRSTNAAGQPSVDDLLHQSKVTQRIVQAIGAAGWGSASPPRGKASGLQASGQGQPVNSWQGGATSAVQASGLGNPGSPSRARITAASRAIGGGFWQQGR